jgi:mannosyl-oligosaccharide alpha-1,2-mannosidase
MLNQLQGRLGRRYIALVAFLIVSFFLWRHFDYVRSAAHDSTSSSSSSPSHNNHKIIDSFKYLPSTYDWSKAELFFPPKDIKSPPAGHSKRFPKIQASVPPTSPKNSRPQAKKEMIKAKFVKSWEAYKTYAWTNDELMPLSGKGKKSLSGWSAQLVDALDTLWIMGLKDEFRRAVKEVAVIDWAKTPDKSVNLFEVTIRYLGGLIAAYELSEEPALLDKARELGDTLYMAFDTPNRLPNHYLSFDKAKIGKQLADPNMSGAAGGSLCMEFTRLSQLTGDPKYYDATERVKQFLYRVQNETTIPGLLPLSLDWKEERPLLPERFTFGAGADSLYEYFPKMHALLGGLDPQYEEMTVAALDAAKANLLYRPMTPEDANILLSGNALLKKGEQVLSAEMEHLTCFAGGMYGLAGRLLSRDDYVDLGSRLAAGCVWMYDAFETNIMPEISQLVPCENLDGPCKYDAAAFGRTRLSSLPAGILRVRDRRYLLRPEAIESVFYMWRITGDQVWRDAAWRMYEGIVRETETEMAFASINDVTVRLSDKVDSMEVRHSFLFPLLFLYLDLLWRLT